MEGIAKNDEWDSAFDKYASDMYNTIFSSTRFLPVL